VGAGRICPKWKADPVHVISNAIHNIEGFLLSSHVAASIDLLNGRKRRDPITSRAFSPTSNAQNCLSQRGLSSRNQPPQNPANPIPDISFLRNLQVPSKGTHLIGASQRLSPLATPCLTLSSYDDETGSLPSHLPNQSPKTTAPNPSYRPRFNKLLFSADDNPLPTTVLRMRRAPRIKRTGTVAYSHWFSSIGMYDVKRYARPMAMLAMPS
jgi:hypothetical protein